MAKNLRTGLTKGRRVVGRVQMDHPNQPAGVPQWLIDSGGRMNPYDDKEVGKGLSTDYEDPRLRGAGTAHRGHGRAILRTRLLRRELGF